ncbi:MAG: hypothetical protein IT381_10010 [Deltaproteobacteria bacterium]|nr:hypothetical protein [Deltaproteobacteria bacterium]
MSTMKPPQKPTSPSIAKPTAKPVAKPGVGAKPIAKPAAPTQVDDGVVHLGLTRDEALLAFEALFRVKEQKLLGDRDLQRALDLVFGKLEPLVPVTAPNYNELVAKARAAKNQRSA